MRLSSHFGAPAGGSAWRVQCNLRSHIKREFGPQGLEPYIRYKSIYNG
jgi:hypothetical protein